MSKSSTVRNQRVPNCGKTIRSAAVCLLLACAWLVWLPRAQAGGFTEDFSDGMANNWVVRDGTWSVTDQQYAVRSASGKNSSVYYDATFDDFVFEARMMKASGASTDNLGLFFRGDPSQVDADGNWWNGYKVFFGSGDWQLSRFVNGTRSALVNWTSSPELVNGFGAWNTLKVACTQGTIQVFINGVLQGTAQDSTFSSGTVGLTMFDSDKSGVARFDAVSLVGNAGAEYALEVSALHGEVVRNPDKSLYEAGEEVVLTAVPAPGYGFVEWSGDAAGAANPLTLTMDGDKQIVATFVAEVRVPLRITGSMVEDDGRMQITFAKGEPPAATFQLDSAPSVTGPWEVVENAEWADAGITGTFHVAVPEASGGRFFRVVGLPGEPPLDPGTLTVPDDHPTITAAVNAAPAGGTVRIRSGTYHERLQITKVVRLVGLGDTAPVIDAQGLGVGILVNTSQVKIENLQVINGWGAGIKLDGVSGCHLTDCRIRQVDGLPWEAGRGLWLVNATANTLTGLTVSQVRGGGNSAVPVTYNESYGVYLDNSPQNQLTGCQVETINERGEGRGIALSHSGHNSLTQCTIRQIRGQTGITYVGNLGLYIAEDGWDAYGVLLSNSSTVTLEGLTISDIAGGSGGVADNGPFGVSRGDPGTSYGVWAENSGTLVLKGCCLGGCDFGISLKGTTTAVIGGAPNDANAIHDHRKYALYNATPTAQNARANNWDTQTPDTVIYDQLDNPGYGRVDSTGFVYDRPPSFSSQPPTQAVANYRYEYRITTTDPDGDPVRLSAQDLPAWLTLSDAGDGTAVLQGTPTGQDLTQLTVVLTAASGKPIPKSVEQRFTLRVVSNLQFASQPATSVVAGTDYLYEVKVQPIHPVAVALGFTLPAWLQAVDHGDGTARITGHAPAADGEVEIVITATSAGETQEQRFTLEVRAADAVGCWNGAALLDVAAQGTLAYAVGLNGFYVIDCANPHSPTQIGVTAAGGSQVLVSGPTAVVIYENAFGLVEVAAPANPSLLKVYNMGDLQIRHGAWDGVRLYLLCSDLKLYILDLSDRYQANLKSATYMGSGAAYSRIDDLAFADRRVYCVDGYDMGLQILEVSDPALPERLDGWFGMWGGFAQVATTEGKVCITRQSGWENPQQQLCVIDPASPSAPQGTLALDGYPLNAPVPLAASQNFLYLLSATGAMAVDIANPSQPKVVRHYSGLTGELRQIAATGDRVFVAGEKGLFVDLAPSRNPAP